MSLGTACGDSVFCSVTDFCESWGAASGDPLISVEFVVSCLWGQLGEGFRAAWETWGGLFYISMLGLSGKAWEPWGGLGNAWGILWGGNAWACALGLQGECFGKAWGIYKEKHWKMLGECFGEAWLRPREARPREAQRGGAWIEQACHALGWRLPPDFCKYIWNLRGRPLGLHTTACMHTYIHT